MTVSTASVLELADHMSRAELPPSAGAAAAQRGGQASTPFTPSRDIEVERVDVLA